MSESDDVLSAIPDDVWISWQEASADPLHPFRTLVLATLDGGEPRLRTVILREADPAEARLTLHTDLRSGKVGHIEGQPRIELLFYDRTERIQVRVQGDAEVVREDPRVDAAWQSLVPEQRLNYLSRIRPGGALPGANPETDDETTARARFGLVDIRAEGLDWLRLGRAGSRRAVFTRTRGAWNGTWVAP